MIVVDTDVMKALVAASSSANEAISEAVDALEKITVHNDWGCREKNSINEYTIRNKNTIKILQEKSRSFLDTLNQVSNEFETSEKNIANMFSSVETLLAGMFSIGSSVVGGPLHTGTVHPGMFEGFKEIWTKKLPDDASSIIDKLSVFEVTNFDKEISICKFSDIEL